MSQQLTREQIIEQALKASHVRSMVIERAEQAEGEEDSRTVEMSFASDTPITHFSWSQWRWIDIQLSLEAGHVRTERLQNGAPLLADHNHRDQIGVIESFELDAKDGKARAKVRFSKSARGEEIYRDVLDGIRKNVSVGFMIHKLVLKEERDKKKGEIDLYEATDWEPYECSIVAVPADISVGVGRQLEFPRSISEQPAEERQNPTTEKTMEENKNNPPAPPAVDERQNALAAAREVREWGEVLGEQDAASAYLRETGDKANKDGFMSFLRGRQTATPTAPVLPAAEEAARQGSPRAELARSLPRHGTVRSFQGENADEKAYRFGAWLLAGPISRKLQGNKAVEMATRFCQEQGLVRAINESVNEEGGYLVPEEFGNDLIDLREMYGVFRRNAKIVPMGSDTRTDPRRTGGLTAYFVGEGAAITESDLGWDQVGLTAKKLAVLTRMSSEVSEDSIINLGDTVAGEIAYAFAEKEDQCGFNGDGTSTYGGITGVREKLKGLSGTIANIAGLQVGSGNAYSELTLADFEGVVARLPQYADTDRAAWFVHRSFYWNVMVKVMLASGGVTAAEIEDARRQRFMGYRVEFSQVMPKAEANDQVCALLGDLALGASFGDRRSTTLATSEHSRFAYDQIEIRGTERFDINVHSVGNASATAADRVAGPIVGLITAGS